MTRTFCFSSPKMTVLVVCDEQNLITETAPITQKFVGQHIKQLADWMRGHGEFQHKEIKPFDPELQASLRKRIVEHL